MLKGSSLLPDTQTADPDEQFELLDYLGQGAYGSVSKALHKRTGNLYAIKILPATTHSQLATIKKEIQILKLCDNEHIVKYYGSYFKDGKLWIVLEYCHAGSIIDLINITQRKLNEHEIASILESVLQGLAYLHANRKIHRDIKAANILLNSEGVAKLADFGVSTESMYTNARHRSQVGSPYWMSPEVLRNSEYTNKTDIWSLGVTAIELAEGVVPNAHIKPYVAIFQLKDKPTQGFQDPNKWSPEFNAFVRECLNTTPGLRPEAKSLLTHEFITKYSRGQRLLAELVQNSLSDIEQFRRGQEQNYEGAEFDILNMINASGLGTKTIVNNQTERSQASQAEKDILREMGEDGNSSMVVNEQDGSVIINAGEDKEKPTAFLNRYINGLKNSENEVEAQRQALRRKIADYDTACLAEIELVFSKYRGIIADLLSTGAGQQFNPVDSGFIRDEIASKLHRSQTVKDFLVQFPRYQERRTVAVSAMKEAKEFQRSQLAKKKSQFSEMAHHSTQTNDVGYTDLSQFREVYQRGVKSQEFNEKEFRTTEKHCFNSKSIISDMENVRQANKRTVLTEPYDWSGNETQPAAVCSPSPDTQVSSQEREGLKQVVAQDFDIKASIKQRAKALPKGIFESTAQRPDRVTESTLYHDEAEEAKHQSSLGYRGLTVKRRSEQEQLQEQRESEEMEVTTNFFQEKPSTAKNSKNEPRKKPKQPQKRIASSEKRTPAGKSASRKNHK